MEYVFRSTRHTGDLPAAVLFGQALARPVGICALPVMLGALATMLQDGRPLPFLTVGFPISLVIAWFWTAHRLRSAVVEITISDGLVRVRSLWDVATRRAVGPGSAVLDVRRDGTDLLVTVGLDTLALERDEWADVEGLEDALRTAHEAHVRNVLTALNKPRHR